MNRKMLLAGFAGTAILAVPTSAYAQAINESDGSIVFYIGTSGDDRGNDFRGTNHNAKLCADGPTSAPQQFDTRFRINRSFSPDDTLAEIRPNYFQPRRCSGSKGFGTGTVYHLDINWSQASGAKPGRENGYTEHDPA